MRKYILFIYMVCHLLHVYAGNLENKINSSYAMFRTDEGEIGKVASAGSIVNKFIPFNG